MLTFSCIEIDFILSFYVKSKVKLINFRSLLIQNDDIFHNILYSFFFYVLRWLLSITQQLS